MFRHFVHHPASVPKKTKSAPEDFFLFAEFDAGNVDEFSCLSLALTDGHSAWLAKVAGSALQKLAADCRIGAGTREDFVEQTRKAFAEPSNTQSDDTLASTYVIDMKFSSSTRDSLDLKWKLKEKGFSQIIGQAKLSLAPDQNLVIDRMLDAVLRHNQAMETDCADLSQKIEESSSATMKLREFIQFPSVTMQLNSRCTEVLNAAKEKNRELGRSSQKTSR